MDKIRTGDEFNLISMYEDTDGIEDDDSPFQAVKVDCDYYEPHEFHDMAKQIINPTSYFHLNCRGLSANWDSFYDLMYQLHSDAFSFDYIGISELFRCKDDNRLTLPGYHKLIARCRDDGPRGGVGLFIRDSINSNCEMTLAYLYLMSLKLYLLKSLIQLLKI